MTKPNHLKRKRLAEFQKYAAPGPVLRGEDADACAIAYFVDAVKEVDDRKLGIQHARLRPEIERMLGARVDLRIERQVIGIGEAVTQAAAVEQIDTVFHVMKIIRSPCRPRDQLIVIEMHGVGIDVVNLGLIEERWPEIEFMKTRENLAA